jgi:hypothetical protein
MTYTGNFFFSFPVDTMIIMYKLMCILKALFLSEIVLKVYLDLGV